MKFCIIQREHSSAFCLSESEGKQKVCVKLATLPEKFLWRHVYLRSFALPSALFLWKSRSWVSERRRAHWLVCPTFCISSVLSIRFLSQPSQSFKVNFILAYKWLDASFTVCVCVCVCIWRPVYSVWFVCGLMLGRVLISYVLCLMSQLAISSKSKLLDTWEQTHTHKVGKLLHLIRSGWDRRDERDTQRGTGRESKAKRNKEMQREKQSKQSQSFLRHSGVKW